MSKFHAFLLHNSVLGSIRCLPISPFLLPVNPVLRAAHIYLPVKGTENVIYCHKATISSKRCSSLVCNVKTEHSSQNDVRQAQGREEVAYCPHLPPVAASPAAQNLISGRKWITHSLPCVFAHRCFVPRQLGPFWLWGGVQGARRQAWLPGSVGWAHVPSRGLPGHSEGPGNHGLELHVWTAPDHTWPVLGPVGPPSITTTPSWQRQRGRALLRPSDAGVRERPADH